MPGYLQLGKPSLPKKFSFYYETFLRVVHIRSIPIGHAGVIICSVALSSAGILLLSISAMAILMPIQRICLYLFVKMYPAHSADSY